MKLKDSSTNIQGNVTIYELNKGVEISKKTVHNNATLHMMSGLLRFLRGDFSSNPQFSSDFLPRYLSAGTSNSNEWTAASDNLVSEITTNSYRFDMTATGIELDELSNLKTATLTLVGNIPSNVYTANTQIKEIGLYYTRPTGSNSLLARVALTGNDIITVQQNISIRIEWQIILSNRS